MKPQSSVERWHRLERNEEEWFSLWCETADLESARIFYNIHFADDPLYNHATLMTSKADDASTSIEEVIRFFAQRRLTPCFYVSAITSPKGFTDLLVKNGFVQYDQMMVLDLTGEPPRSEDSPIGITDIDDDSVVAWAKTFIQSFDISDTWFPEVVRRSREVVSHNEAALLLGYVDEEPAGTVALYSKSQAGGIYCLGTIRTHRGKGVASALLREAIFKSKNSRNDVLCLQTLAQDRLSEFYRRRGFSNTFTRSIYIKPQVP